MNLPRMERVWAMGRGMEIATNDDGLDLSPRDRDELTSR
jgi:hypothetical protein